VKIALAATIVTITVAKMSSSSSEAESPDIKPKVATNVRGKDSEKEKKEVPVSDDEEEKVEVKEGEEKKPEEEADDGSRWRKLYNKTAFTFTSSRDSAAAAAAAKKQAAAEKLRATQESIIASKNAAAEAAYAKKEAAAAAAYAKKEAAAAAAKARKDAAAAKLWETTDSIKTSTNNATSAVKSSSTNAASSVNAGFWNVVQIAQKAAVDPKSMLPGRAAEQITLIHFNDISNVESRDQEPVGGAARFLAAIKKEEEAKPCVIFSGNAFSPSMMSTLTKGEQMVPILNTIGTQCAVFGNHDFDYGLDVFTQHREKTEFPWIISNVIDSESGQPLGGGKVHHTIEWEGRKLGIIGLVEREWLDTVSTLDKEHLDYTDYIDAASMLATELKRKGCEYIIAVTHMRTDNDVRLAEKVPEINLILGGHSLVYEKRKVNGVYILKSGSDFRQFSKINLDFRETPVVVEIECIDVTKDIEPDEELSKKLEEYNDIEETKTDEILGKLGSDLDGRFSTVRTSESNLGNLMADVAMAALQADCALLNAGTIRSNTKHAKGEFKLKDLLSILPVIDSLVLIDVKGEHIHQALENGVSQWPKLDSRFPQVGGITFIFDPAKPPGSRIDPAYIKIGTEYMDKHQHYKLATKSALASGEDGYSGLAQGVILIDDQCAPSLTAAMLNHFKSVKMKKLGDEDEEANVSVHHQCLVTRSCFHQERDITKRINTAAKLRPKVDGRIVQSSAEVLAKLKEEKELHKSGSNKKKSKHRASSPSDEARKALFDSPNKKANGVNGTSKSKSKKSTEASDDLK